MRTCLRRASALATAALFILSTPSPAASEPLYQTELGAPFDSWNVEVTPLAQNPQVLTLDFDSDLLGLRARVVRTPAGAAGVVESVSAGADRRITISVELGPPRDLDERKALVEGGQFQFPQTRVEVLEN